LARKKKGSSSRTRQKRLVAKAHLHVHNQRLDLARKLAVQLFRRFDLVSFEDLNITRMIGGNLAKSIHDASWRLLTHALVCKAEYAGKHARGVDPRGTTQRCSRCENVPAEKLTLSDRVHPCRCSPETPPLDRDHNAALNIDALGLSVVESSHEKAA
jgi:putative transposase